MSDRAVRNLALIQSTASTSRVLNLHSVWRTHQDNSDWAERPLFANPHLNRALIIKHRLRRDERDLFTGRRRVVTKVVMPLDPHDLRLGGRYVYVNQKAFTAALQNVFGASLGERDLDTLRLIDQLPSLDPFLMREQLKRHGRTPDRCYFDLTDADMKRMFAFAQTEISALVAMSLGSSEGVATHAAVLVNKILSNADGEEMEPLRLTLRLEKDEYAEGVFCWKGFLYYKWSLSDLRREVERVFQEIEVVKPFGPLDDESRSYLARGRVTLRRKINRALTSVAETLKVYDDAYSHLTDNGRPTAFREFLLDAPYLFTRLGDQVGALQHIISFWSFRFRDQQTPISVDELIDIFMDFETSLAERGEEPGQLLLAS